MRTLSKNKAIEQSNNHLNPIKKDIPVHNAGIVLLSGFLDILFQRLKLTEKQKFTSLENQIKAVHSLQYLITGISGTEQTYLSLNKVLCGFSINEIIPDEVDIPEENKALINGLMYAAIGHWPEIGNSSIDGFRGNWLIRDGNLVELEDKWELTVQKRAYDLLLSKSPFYFSIVRYPWMNKPLYVKWL
jgi:hypothetical protein